jgi:Flp pilus assembly protein TadG
MNGAPGPLRALGRCRRGASAAEFGIIAPVMVLLVAGLADIGAAMQQAIRLENAARAGAQFAMSFPSNQAGIAAAAAAALGSAGAGATVVASAPFCACPGGGDATVACEGTPCAGAPSGTYVTVTVTRPFSAIVGIGSFVLPATLRGDAVTRVR